MVAVEGGGSSPSWCLDQCEPSAGLSMYLPVSKDDPKHVSTFRQCRGYGLSPMGSPQKSGRSAQASFKRGESGQRWILPIYCKKMETIPICHIAFMPTAQLLPPPQPAGCCWAIGPNFSTILPLSTSLTPWIREELTLDLQPWRRVWVALASALKGHF